MSGVIIHHSSICLNFVEHVPCILLPPGYSLYHGVMYAARVHVLSDTVACLCFMFRLCPKEAIDQDQYEGGV